MWARELGNSAIGFGLALLLIGSAIALVVALAFAVARNAAPRVRYGIAVLAFLAAVVIPMLPYSAGDAHVAPPADRSAETRRVQEARTSLRVGDDVPFAPYSLVAWLVVAAALLLREIGGHVLLSLRRSEWEAAPRALREVLQWPDDVPLFVSRREGPSTIGLLRPAVVLPSRWLGTITSEIASRFARHELAHARWRDPLVHAVVRFVRAIFWPSVPLWFLERVIRTEREVAADAYAVAWRVEDHPRSEIVVDYAASLVDEGQHDVRSPGVATALGKGVAIDERVRRLLAAAPPAPWRIALAAAILCSGFAAMRALPEVAPHAAPPPFDVSQRATPEYEAAALAMNEILSRTRFHDHEATPAVRACLARIRASGTIQPLVDALRASDRRTRESVAWISGELGDPALAPALIAAHRDCDPYVRRTAAGALARLGREDHS